MEKLTLIALALSLLFSLSDSLPTSDLNGRDDLLLPSDNPRAVHDTDSPDAVANPKSAITESEHEHEGFVSVPLTKLDFHEGSIPLSLRFPHRRRFGRGCRHGFIRPREIPFGNDMILSDKKEGTEEFVGRSRFDWVNSRPSFEVAAPWMGEEGVFQKPKKFEGGFDEEDRFKRPKKFWHHDEDEDDVFKRPKKFRHHDEDEDDVFKRPKKFRHHDEDEEEDEDDVLKRPKKFDHDDEDHMFEMLNKLKHDNFRTPRKFMHHDDDDDNDWHKEKHHHRHHHKHHHEDDEEDGPHEHGKHRHHDDDEDDKSGILSKMGKFFDDLF